MLLRLLLLVSSSAAFVASPGWYRGAHVSQLASTAEEPMLTDAQRDAKKAFLEFKVTKYFFGRVQVYMGERFKPLSEVFEPTFSDDSSAMSSVVVESPFGMVIEESERCPGRIEASMSFFLRLRTCKQVIEIVEGSNAEKAGVQAGDILRGTTAMALNIQRAAEEDAAFSVGLSEGKKERAFLNADRQPFENVMSALQSNAAANGGPGEACLVFERRIKEPSA